MITVVGLGRRAGDLSQNGLKAIQNADKLFVRTLQSRAGKQTAKYAPQSMDDLYESADDFDALNLTIAQRILDADADGFNVVYGVDGDGFTDTSVVALHKQYPDLRFVAGVSDTPPAAPSSSVQLYAAADLPFWPDTSIPLLLRGLSDRFLAGEVKLWLLRCYGADCTVYVCEKDTCLTLPLAELDRQKKYNYDSFLYIPAQEDFNKARYGYSDLLRIMTRLCAPDGCPWDREQTHASIAKNALEEANELVEAIGLNDWDNLEEECGDVMLQSVFHGFIGERYGEFTAEDVVDRLCKKLVSRHTHVFGADKACNSEEALMFWKQAKKREKENM